MKDKLKAFKKRLLIPIIIFLLGAFFVEILVINLQKN